MAQKFTDNSGRVWEVAITTTDVKRLRARLDIDLMKFFGEDAARIYDPPVLVDALFLLCEEQCKQRNITDEQFGRAMAGDVLEEAGNALAEAVIHFFPSPKRPTLRRILDKGRALAATLDLAVMEAVEKIDPTSFASATKSAG